MALNVRHVRRLAGLLLLLGLGYVGWLVSRIERRPSAAVKELAAKPEEMPKSPEEETGCFDDFVFDWAGDRLEAGRACKQPDGFSQLQRVVLHLRRDDGAEQMIVRADRGRTSETPGEPIELTGNVQVDTPQGLRVQGESLVVDKTRHLVRSAQPVTFTQGDLSGSGGRLEHDWESGHTLLEAEPVLRLKGNRTDGRELTLTGERLDHSEKDRRLVATGGADLQFPDGSISGNSVEVILGEEAEEVRRITAIGGAATRVVGASSGPSGGGPLLERTLRAERIDHDFAAGSMLDRVEAANVARLIGRSLDEAEGIAELLEGVTIVLDFGATDTPRLDGIVAHGTPARFERTEPGTLRRVVGSDLRLESGASGFERLVVDGAATVHDESATGQRTLTADHADIRFAASGAHLDTLAFEGKPGRLRSADAAGKPLRTVTARSGELRFDAAGEPVAGTLSGAVEILDEGLRATGEQATLESSPARRVITGRAAVESEGRTSHGDEITHDVAAGTLTVAGNQHTLVRDEKGMPGMAAGETDEPIVISSDTLVLDEKAKRAEYTGGRVMLRRGDTELLADRLVLDDASKAMHAYGDVRSRLRLAKPGAEPRVTDAPFDPTRLVDGTADEFHHRQSERLVTYLGDAKLEQEDTVLTAHRVDIRLTEAEPAQVETLVAEGGAFFRAPLHGEAEGERIRMIAAEDAIRVEGGTRPARAIDAQGNFQTGAVIEMTPKGVRALTRPSGRTRGSSPTLEAPNP